MDLPEVIALRRELIPEQPGNPYIAAPCWKPTGWTTCAADIPTRISSSWSKAC